MRLAATLQAMRHGPGALPAREVVRMATRGGARALGLDADIGAITVGRKADLVVVAAGTLHQAPAEDIYARLVYSARPDDVRLTIVDGRVFHEGGGPSWADPADLVADARQARARLVSRAGL